MFHREGFSAIKSLKNVSMKHIKIFNNTFLDVLVNIVVVIVGVWAIGYIAGVVFSIIENLIE